MDKISILEAEIKNLRELLAAQAHANHLLNVQTQALISLVSFLKPRYPLPNFDTWSVAPDLGLILAKTIVQRKPSVIVELGSGLSSLIMGYCLAHTQTGRLITLEHDPTHASRTRELITLHGLDKYVQVVYSPLTHISVEDQMLLWYRTDLIADALFDDLIDLLFVDGPPGYLQKKSRCPALPALYQYLALSAMVIVDDARRADEAAMVTSWISDFPEFVVEAVDTLRGTTFLRRDDT